MYSKSDATHRLALIIALINKETEMKNLRPTLTALGLATLMTGALAGCASYPTCGSGGCTPDAKLTANVETAFAQHPELQPQDSIVVQTEDHVVYLSGVVDADLEVQDAESVAREVPGVTGVVNTLVSEN
jgi:hypothetical protein